MRHFQGRNSLFAGRMPDAPGGIGRRNVRSSPAADGMYVGEEANFRKVKFRGIKLLDAARMGRKRAVQPSEIDKWHDCLYAMAGMRIMGEDDWRKFGFFADLPPVNPRRG